MLYDKIKDLCKQKGISVRSVEIKAGLSNGSISKWNEVMPKADGLQAVAKILNTSVEALLEDEEEK